MAVDPMPPHLLAMSLKHINTLLSSINNKILYEKELLSQLDLGEDKDLTRQSKVNPYPAGKEGARNLIQLWKEMSRVGGIVPEVEKDPTDETEIACKKLTTTTPIEPNISDKEYPKRVMKLFMKQHDVSYSFGALHRTLGTLYNKPDDEFEAFADTCTTALWGLGESGKLECLGSTLGNRLLKLSMWMKLVAPQYAKKYMLNIITALETKSSLMNNRAQTAAKTYDSLFNDEEGDQLLDSALIIDSFDINKRGKDQATKVCEDFLIKILAPANRLCETNNLKSLITEINDVYEKLSPFNSISGRKSIIDALIDPKSLPRTNFNASLCMKYKFIKCDFASDIRELIKKFPTAFDEVIKHHENSKERSYRNLIETSEPPNNSKQINRSERLTEKYSRNMITFFLNNIKNTVFDQSNIRNTKRDSTKFTIPITVTPMKISNKLQKRFQNVQNSIPDNSTTETVLLNHPGIEFYNNRGDDTADLEHSHFTINLYTESDFTTKKKRKKTILDNIVEESSYSDEENYLRVMLKDALFHGNKHDLKNHTDETFEVTN